VIESPEEPVHPLKIPRRQLKVNEISTTDCFLIISKFSTAVNLRSSEFFCKFSNYKVLKLLKNTSQITKDRTPRNNSSIISFLLVINLFQSEERFLKKTKANIF
jgi:hypothetical protein